MVILRNQNKITDFFMILAWVWTFNPLSARCTKSLHHYKSILDRMYFMHFITSTFLIFYGYTYLGCTRCILLHPLFLFFMEGGGPRVVVSTAAFHARVRGSVPGLGGLKETKNVSSPSTCESQYCGEPP